MKSLKPLKPLKIVCELCRNMVVIMQCGHTICPSCGNIEYCFLCKSKTAYFFVSKPYRNFGIFFQDKIKVDYIPPPKKMGKFKRLKRWFKNKRAKNRIYNMDDIVLKYIPSVTNSIEWIDAYV